MNPSPVVPTGVLVPAVAQNGLLVMVPMISTADFLQQPLTLQSQLLLQQQQSAQQLQIQQLQQQQLQQFNSAKTTPMLQSPTNQMTSTSASPHEFPSLPFTFEEPNASSNASPNLATSSSHQPGSTLNPTGAITSSAAGTSNTSVGLFSSSKQNSNSSALMKRPSTQILESKLLYRQKSEKQLNRVVIKPTLTPAELYRKHRIEYQQAREEQYRKLMQRLPLVKVCFQSYEDILFHWEHAKGHVKNVPGGICVMVALPYLQQLKIDLVPVRTFTQSVKESCSFLWKKLRRNILCTKKNQAGEQHFNISNEENNTNFGGMLSGTEGSNFDGHIYGTNNDDDSVVYNEASTAFRSNRHRYRKLHKDKLSSKQAPSYFPTNNAESSGSNRQDNEYVSSRSTAEEAIDDDLERDMDAVMVSQRMVLHIHAHRTPRILQTLRPDPSDKQINMEYHGEYELDIRVPPSWIRWYNRKSNHYFLKREEWAEFLNKRCLSHRYNKHTGLLVVYIDEIRARKRRERKYDAPYYASPSNVKYTQISSNSQYPSSSESKNELIDDVPFGIVDSKPAYTSVEKSLLKPLPPTIYSHDGYIVEPEESNNMSNNNLVDQIINNDEADNEDARLSESFLQAHLSKSVDNSSLIGFTEDQQLREKRLQIWKSPSVDTDARYRQHDQKALVLDDALPSSNFSTAVTNTQTESTDVNPSLKANHSSKTSIEDEQNFKIPSSATNMEDTSYKTSTVFFPSLTKANSKGANSLKDDSNTSANNDNTIAKRKKPKALLLIEKQQQRKQQQKQDNLLASTGIAQLRRKKHQSQGKLSSTSLIPPLRKTSSDPKIPTTGRPSQSSSLPPGPEDIEASAANQIRDGTAQKRVSRSMLSEGLSVSSAFDQGEMHSTSHTSSQNMSPVVSPQTSPLPSSKHLLVNNNSGMASAITSTSDSARNSPSLILNETLLMSPGSPVAYHRYYPEDRNIDIEPEKGYGDDDSDSDYEDDVIEGGQIDIQEEAGRQDEFVDHYSSYPDAAHSQMYASYHRLSEPTIELPRRNIPAQSKGRPAGYDEAVNTTDDSMDMDMVLHYQRLALASTSLPPVPPAANSSNKPLHSSQQQFGTLRTRAPSDPAIPQQSQYQQASNQSNGIAQNSVPMRRQSPQLSVAVPHQSQQQQQQCSGSPPAVPAPISSPSRSGSLLPPMHNKHQPQQPHSPLLKKSFSNAAKSRDTSLLPPLPPDITFEEEQRDSASSSANRASPTSSTPAMFRSVRSYQQQALQQHNIRSMSSSSGEDQFQQLQNRHYYRHHRQQPPHTRGIEVTASSSFDEYDDRLVRRTPVGSINMSSMDSSPADSPIATRNLYSQRTLTTSGSSPNFPSFRSRAESFSK